MARAKRVKHVSTFTAEDASGRRYRISEFQDMIDVGTSDDPGAELPGLRRLRTQDDRAVNRVEKGKYEIVGHPNIPVTSTDPAAP